MAHNSNKKKFNVFDLFRDVEKLYGVLYMLLLAFILFLGTKYVKTLDYNKLFYTEGLLAADSNMRAELTAKKGSITSPVDVMKVSVATPDMLSKGKDLYITNCASCHGETGAGNGPAGTSLNPPPRNFVNPQPWKIGPKISNMYVTLQEGIPNTGMASFSTMLPEDRFAIIQYVQTFNPTYPKDSPEDLVKLDEKYSLSKGLKLANQIPLKVAIELELLDYDTLKADLNSIYAKIESQKEDSAAVIFNEYVSNKNKALNSLSSNLKWNEGPEEFTNFIGTEPLLKGFKATVYQMSQDETNQLYEYLKNLFLKNRI